VPLADKGAYSTVMDKKTTGSWLIYQTGKLQRVTDQSSFEKSYLAGKAGILLSAISKDRDGTLSNDKIQALAKASSINTLTELPVLLQHLSDQGLILLGQNGIEVLGVTTSSCLEHTAALFETLEPSGIEVASLALCEEASSQPLFDFEAKEKVSDFYSLSQDDTDFLLKQACEIGFVDSECIDQTKTLLFNGNLFRRDDVAKVSKVLNSLSEPESKKQMEFAEFLNAHACVPVKTAVECLGKELFKKLAIVGIYDINIVSNKTEEVAYVTRPSAFTKFCNSMVDDAFDLAKIFVSSLTYGMTRSPYARGQIQMIEPLMRTHLSGQPVGPVDAIGEDYKILEMKHVVEVFNGAKNGRTGNMMRLLKNDVGMLALEVIKKADASEHSLSELPTAAINRFKGPETNRTALRRREIELHPKLTNDILLSLRTGGKKR